MQSREEEIQLEKKSTLLRVRAANGRSVDKTIRKAGDKRTLTEKLAGWHVWEILAFILPFLFLGAGFYNKEMHPFFDLGAFFKDGTVNTYENQFLVTDLWHQYYPFFQILHDKLTNGGSLLYTWISGIGTNFIAMMAYYAASPLNLLCIFMDTEHLRDGMMFILMLKFSFAGLFFARMLKYVFGKNDLSITMFGVMFALCSYMMGYYWNTIWIDTVALLPLVMHGLTALVREGKYRTYVIALALALISNYYIAYMICIFTVIAFFLLCMYESVSFKTLLKRFGLITGGSLLGAGLASWIIIPAYFALQLTHSANNSFPKDVSFYEEWRDIVANMLAFTEPTSKEGLPNLYTGLLPVLLLGVFLVAKKIRIREKISAVLLMVFLIVSCNMNMLNYIWHGFHFTNMLPYRFSFLFSFVLLVAAYRAYQVLLEEKLHVVHWIAMLVVGGIFCWLGYGSGIQTEDHKFVYASAILGGVYLSAIFCRLFAPKQFVQILLSGILIYEMGSTAINGVEAVGSSGYTSYPSNNSEIQSLLDDRDKLETEPFSRTELTMWYTLNDPSLYGYNGVSQFSSMANESVTTFLREIGVPASEAGNRYYYANTSPLTNMLLDVNFMMAKDGYNADTFSMHQVSANGNCTLYKNDYNIGMGFVMNRRIRSFIKDTTLNAFDMQNEIFKSMTGIDKELFTRVDITHVGHTGYDVSRRDYGDYSYTRMADASGETYLKYNYTAIQDSMLYAYMTVKDGDNMDVYFDNARVHRYNIGRQPYITPIGSYKTGDMVTLRCDLDEEAKSGTIKVYVYELNEDVLKEGYEILRKGSLHLTDFSDTKLTGELTAENDGTFYISIPYEEGWSLRVDGVRTEIDPLFGAMCAVDLKAGKHTIEMRYAPKGFVPGVLIVCVSVGILVLMYVLERKTAKKKASQPTETPDDNEDNSKEDADSSESETDTAENMPETDAAKKDNADGRT